MRARGARSPQRRARRDDERGIAVVWLAITIFVLLGIAAIAVDLVHGYLEAQKAQNAADAASLAGVVYLPNDVDTAVSTALDNARENGFENGVDNATVTATQLSTATRLKVEVRKTFPTFFARAIGFSTLTVRRSATADYDPPVALGSPENSFGFQPYRGVWGAINGYCASREDGDLRASRYHSNRPQPGGNTVCPADPAGPTTPATLNNDYDPEGYSYLVEMRKAPANSVALQVFDGPYWSGCGANTPAPPVAPAGTTCPDSGAFYSGTPDITTTFEVWDLNNTPYDKNDDTLLDTVSFGTTTDPTVHNRWDTIAMLPPATGIYRVKVSTQADQPASVGSNGFALGARVGGSSGSTTAALPRCVNDANEAAGGITYDPSCPHVYAEKEMSVFANQGSATANFFLAEVSRANAGKTMIITLFDPGEGGQTLQVLDPSGTPATFTWETVDGDTGWPQYSGSGTSLDISQTVNPKLPDHQSASRFSDRKLELKISLPPDYSPTGTDWWKLSYHFAASVSDRTTWGARIIGNPVRLVQ